MNYKWVIAGTVVFGILTTIRRWYMNNVSYELIERSNDPYVYLLGVVIILHFFYFLFKGDELLKKFNINKEALEKNNLGIVIILILLVVLGLIGSFIANLFY